MISLSDRLSAALKEDGFHHDVTTLFFVEEKSIGQAAIIAKDEGVFCGATLLSTLNELLAQSFHIDINFQDGQAFNVSDCLAILTGPIASALSIERVMLNLLQRSCGIASLTQRYVQALDDTAIRILDTRKTLPLWRDLDRLAVKAGGGFNHRFNLSDMMLIKENHLHALHQKNGLSSLPKLLSRFREGHPSLKIEMEIETVKQLQSFDLKDLDYLLLDHFSLSDLDFAITYCQNYYPKIHLEVSGNITLDNIHRYRGKAIQRISCGALTHSVPACDLSFLMQ